MREEIRIQTVIATRRIDDRNGKRESVKERLRERENVTKKKNGEEAREQAKKGKGCVREGEQLCRSKWLGLIRHETLHTGAKKAEMTCYVSQSASLVRRRTPMQWTVNLTVQSFIHSPSTPQLDYSILKARFLHIKRHLTSLRAICSHDQRSRAGSESQPLSVSWSGSPFIKQLLQSQYIIIYPVTYLASWSVRLTPSYLAIKKAGQFSS